MTDEPTYEELEKEIILLRKKIDNQNLIEEKLREVKKLAMIGHWDWDYENGILSWSDEIFDIFGVIKGDFEVSTENFENTIHPDDKDFFLTEREKALNAGKNVNIIHRIIKPNGEIRIVHERATIIRKNNQPIRLLGTVQDITERKQAEQALKEKENLLFVIAKNYPNSYISVINEDLTIGFTSGQEFYRQNLNPNDYVGLKLEQVFGEHFEIVKENYFKTFKGEETSFELFINNQYQLYRAVPLFDENNKISQILAVAEDITSRKQTEKALQESEEILRICINSTSDIVFTLDTEQRHTGVFGDWAERAGMSKFDFLGKTAKEILGENSLIHEQANLRVLKGEHIVYEWSSIIGNNTIYYQTSLSPLFSKNKIVGIIGVGRNITELKNKEQSIQAEIERFQITMNSINAGVYVSDLDSYELIFANKYYLDLFGNIIGKKCYSALQGQTSPCDFCNNHLLIDKDGKPTQTHIWEIQNKITQHWYQLRDQLIRWTNGKLVRLEIATDITERKQAEFIINQQNVELKKLNADKDRFITILAHDLKSPFNSILGFLHLLTENIRKYDIDKIEKQLNIINNSAQNTFNLLEDILMWVRANSGKIPYEPQNINFATICNEVIVNLKLTANTKNITINHFATDNIRIFADKNMINTILRNLVSNSIKFTNKNGQIDIYAETNHTNVIITVSDNGIGIETDTLNKLFDISQKISTDGTENEKGTGLGLLLCKEFVEKHNGKIWVESELGKGSDFKFTMPLCND